MTTGRPLGLPLIQRKLAPPADPEYLVTRSRLNELLTQLIDRHRVVLACATPGAGKTTAVVEATRLLGWPAAWLSVDHTDTAPGHLVTYLEGALAKRRPNVQGVATGALAAGIPHAEAVGLLIEAVGDEPIVLVVDELERLGEEPAAWDVIASLVRYAPPTARIVLISRRQIPASVAASPQVGRIAAITEEDLAFTTEEAAEALSKLGQVDIAAAEAVEQTGGWVTGVLFEAWRAVDHVAGIGGEADPLDGYLATHILGQLDARDTDFLIATSLLDEVTVSRAEALGASDASERLEALRAAHLPVVWSGDRRRMRCHSRFHEHLRDRLERHGGEKLRGLRLAHGELLASEGRHEEATEEFLRASALKEAVRSGERAIFNLVERFDHTIAERWLAGFADAQARTSNQLSTAELMLAMGQDDVGRAVRIADQLAALGRREQLAAASERAAALMGWAYAHVARLEDAQTVMAAAHGPEVDASRYALAAITSLDGAPTPPEGAGPLDAYVFLTNFYLGRLSRNVDQPSSRWVEAVTRPYRIATLRALGRTSEALALYRAAKAGGQASVSLHSSLGLELLIDCGQLEEAQEAAEAGRKIAVGSGSLAYRAFHAAAVAKLALRLEQDPRAARAALDEVEADSEVRRIRVIAEHLDLWYGLALLRESRNGEALERLRRAVSRMVAGDRILELPTAAVYLSEAEWRCGHDDEADRFAELALNAAHRQGSNHLLLQALADFPEVVSRCVDSMPGPDSPWHALGRALAGQQASSPKPSRVAVHLREFGGAAILVDGEQAQLGLAKAYELLAYLCARGGKAKRSEIIDALFDARADESTRAYLRQAIHRLRRVLPEEAGLVAEAEYVLLCDASLITSDSVLCQARLAEAARHQGEERIATTQEALALLEHGSYLPGVTSQWVEERASELADLATTARYEVAEIAYSLGQFTLALDATETVLRTDPYREAAWRLSMRIASALGDQDGVVTALKECSRALSALGTEPSTSTRRLVEQLRR